MVLALHPHVVGGVEVEEEELLPEGDSPEQVGEAILGWRGESVEHGWEEGVDEESDGDVWVFKVVEMVGRDGAIRVERLVPGRADEELHGYGHGACKHDQVELQILDSWSREPWWGGVVLGVKGVEFYVVK